MPSRPRSVRLYPVEGVTLYPYPAVPFFATDGEWEAIQQYSPVPFTTTRPAMDDAQEAPSEDEQADDGGEG
jgi:hypothetical protein